MEKFTFDWSTVVQIATFVMGLIGGVYTVPMVQKIKTAWNLKGMQVQVLTWVVSFVLAVLMLIVSGQINPQPITVEYVLGLMTLVFAVSQQQYNRINSGDSIVGAAPEVESK